MKNSPFYRALINAIGEHAVGVEADQKAPYLSDWRQRYHGEALAVIFPGNLLEVATVVKICIDAGVSMVPQGGNTSLCGGAIPARPQPEAVVISCARLNAIRKVDAENRLIVAEAGCTLSQVQQAAASSDLLFPLSFASEQRCQVGGNVSTNAGGIQVLRYGTCRDLTLGLEAVLPNGEVLEALETLRKNNTGYDLKQLLIGAEGTLGIITAAAFKLFARPLGKTTVLFGVERIQNAVSLLSCLTSAFDSRLTALELFSDICLKLVLKHIPETQVCWSGMYRWYVLADISRWDPIEDAETRIRRLVNPSLAQLLSITTQPDTIAPLWRLRLSLSEAQAKEGPSIKHDIALPISQIASFILETGDLLQQRFKTCQLQIFGHLGDGNLHYNVSHTRPDPADLFFDEAEVNTVVYDQVARFNGSFSAEHGVGQLKRHLMLRYKTSTSITAMRAIKTALDPKQLMNPGKIL